MVGHVLLDRGLPLIGVERQHGHVDTGVDRESGCAGQVRGHVIGARERTHIAVVADDHALEAHPVAEQRGQQVVRRGRGNPVDRAGIHHDRSRTCVDGARVGRQERVLQVAERQLGLDPVVAVDRLRVPGEVLHGGGDLQAARAAALQAAHVRRAQGGGQGRLLGPGLVVPAPPVVAGQVLNRGEVPVPAGGAERVRGDLAARLGGRRIPGSTHPDGLREQRCLVRVAEAVDGVHAEDDGNVQPRVLDRVALHGVVLGGPVQAGVAWATLAGRVDGNVGSAGQDRADVVVHEDLLLTGRVGQVEPALAGAVAGRVGDLGRLDLHHLADLFRQRHLAEQVADPRLDRMAGVQVRRLAAGRGGRPGHRGRR